MKYVFLILSFTYLSQAFTQTNYASLVNPFIGTGGHGHTYPGATVPHGMVQLSPDTRLEGWDGCSGYHYSDSFIYGFTHTHLSGTGVSDYGDILIMPGQGKPSPHNKEYGSLFRHSTEKASAGYYAVKLDKHDIDAEFTTTERAGFHHYRFNRGDKGHIIFDLKHRDEVISSSLRIEDSVTVTGMRRSRAWADNQYVFFTMKFSRPFKSSGVWENDILQPAGAGVKEAAKNLKAFFEFDLAGSPELFIKLAISPVDIRGAENNLAKELPGWAFRATHQQATNKWNAELSRIEVRDQDTARLRIFYTALYHTAIAPTINMDYDNRYRGRDDQIHNADGYTHYTVFSLWDTYRATHPLYTIIDRARTLDYIKTFLAQYRESGRLPVWELSGCETDCMIGYHSVSVITDAYTKGIRGFDTDLALEAMRQSATRRVLGLPAYMEKAMIETDDESESVSKTLEYAYDDWCIAMFAKNIGNQKVYHEYIQRAQYYKNVFDREFGLMRPRKNGDWLKPFEAREVNNHFTEANSWQYSFYMPQDIGGYIGLIGGKKLFERQLDSLFAAPAGTTGRNQSDITGLIGQYAHGNEPSHHIAYLYNYTSRPDKTQKLVHRIMTEMYADAPDGLIGNEDCGQMSAWYIFSALGFYPVTPGSDIYLVGSPLFDSADIKMENGKNFKIVKHAPINSSGYVKELFLATPGVTPVKYNKAFITHRNIADGGSLEFSMHEKSFTPVGEATSLSTVPAIALEPEIVLNPIIEGGGVPFKNENKVKISARQADVQIRFTTDGSEPQASSSLYKLPILVKKSMTLKAVAFGRNGNRSRVTTAIYNKLPHNWTSTLNTPYEQQYDAGGADGLIDALRGSTDWHKGNWQGYQSHDVEAIIDMHALQNVSEVAVTFLQDTKSWIVMPEQVIIEISIDGKKYIEAYRGEKLLPIEDLKPQIKSVLARFPSTPARYIKLKAKQYGKLPSWHEGAGGDTHIFVDEIEIR